MSNEFYLLLILYHLKLLTFNKSENPFLACLQFSLLQFSLNELLGNFPFVSHTEIFPHVYQTVYRITTKLIQKNQYFINPPYITEGFFFICDLQRTPQSI